MSEGCPFRLHERREEGREGRKEGEKGTKSQNSPMAQTAVITNPCCDASSSNSRKNLCTAYRCRSSAVET